jgi:monoamine oxidase
LKYFFTKKYNFSGKSKYFLFLIFFLSLYMQVTEIRQALHEGLPHESKVGKVLVVGAGIAGLATAQILQKSGVEVHILEATNRVGGRIYTLTDFAKNTIEAGAEFLHGSKSAWFALAEEAQKSLVNAQNFQNVYFFENRLWEEREAYSRHDFAEIDNFYDLLEEADFSEETDFISIAQFLHVINCPPEFRHIIDARLSMDYGTDTHKIDVQALQKVWQKWAVGDSTFFLDSTSYADLLTEICADALPAVVYEKPISQIHYTENSVRAITPKGETWEGEALVLTVPLGVLKKYIITFSPALPAEKQEAIETIGIDAGLKILLKFQKPFWTPDIGGIVGNEFVQEFYPSGKGDDAILTALVMGDKAKYLSDLGEEKAIELVLRELDMMEGSHLASQVFEKGKLIDWTTTPFQWGAYSYPSFQSEEAREILAKPLCPLYFAGEATNTHGHFATVHGALETAYRAAKEVLGLA